MEFSLVAGAREMNRAPGLYQMGEMEALSHLPMCFVFAMLSTYIQWGGQYLYLM